MSYATSCGARVHRGWRGTAPCELLPTIAAHRWPRQRAKDSQAAATCLLRKESISSTKMTLGDSLWARPNSALIGGSRDGTGGNTEIGWRAGCAARDTATERSSLRVQAIRSCNCFPASHAYLTRRSASPNHLLVLQGVRRDGGNHGGGCMGNDWQDAQAGNPSNPEHRQHKAGRLAGQR